MELATTFSRCLIFLFFAVSIGNAQPKAQPNIIIILVDDMGCGGLSCYDNQYFETPEIDKLASEGLLLTDFHSNGAVYSPTRTPRYLEKNSGGALRRGPWKLVKNELYNLYDDPRERKDLALKYPHRVKEMKRERSVIFEEAIGDSPYDQRPNK